MSNHYVVYLKLILYANSALIKKILKIEHKVIQKTSKMTNSNNKNSDFVSLIKEKTAKEKQKKHVYSQKKLLNIIF